MIPRFSKTIDLINGLKAIIIIGPNVIKPNHKNKEYNIWCWLLLPTNENNDFIHYSLKNKNIKIFNEKLTLNWGFKEFNYVKYKRSKTLEFNDTTYTKAKNKAIEYTEKEIKRINTFLRKRN